LVTATPSVPTLWLIALPRLLLLPQHQFVSSIGGEWRYVDCIAKNAGKGRAMVYLASKFGVSLEDVVAAGDSGNDLLMLGRLPEGCHPAIVMSNSHPEVREGGGAWQLY
jgi:sucrose-phosphate synthase